MQSPSKHTTTLTNTVVASQGSHQVVKLATQHHCWEKLHCLVYKSLSFGYVELWQREDYFSWKDKAAGRVNKKHLLSKTCNLKLSTLAQWFGFCLFFTNMPSIPGLRNVFSISQIQLKGTIHFTQRHWCSSFLTASHTQISKNKMQAMSSWQTPLRLHDGAQGMYLLDGAVVNLWPSRDSQLAPGSSELQCFYKSVQHQQSKCSCHYVLWWQALPQAMNSTLLLSSLSLNFLEICKR